MRSLDCAGAVDLAPEFAAGNLCGEERATVIAHLESCPSCQEIVNSLTTVTDQLLLLAPRVEPPPGFEQRVLASLPTELAARRRRQRPRYRWVTLAAAAALVLVFAAGAFLLDARFSGERAVAAAEMRAASGDVIGRVVLHDDEPTLLSMTLPGWADRIERYGLADDRYAVHIETNDGRVTTRPLTVTDDASWATTLDIDADTVTTVAVVDSDGHIWCEAEFA